MPIRPRDLTNLASRLIEETPDEAAVRAAVGRAYYAAFHRLLPLAEKLPKSDSHDANFPHMTHSDLLGRVREWRIGKDTPLAPVAGWKSRASAVYDQMRASRALRHEADYDLDLDVTIEDARMQIGRVKSIAAFCQQIENELARCAA